jgi:hypothetical protein
MVDVDESDGGRGRPSRGGGRARRLGFSGDEKNSGEWLWKRGHFQRATATQAELGRGREAEFGLPPRGPRESQRPTFPPGLFSLR